MQGNWNLQGTVDAELEGGERLLWFGQPNPWRMLPASLAGAAFGVVWTAFVVNFIVLWHSGPRNVQGPGGLFGFHGILIELFFLPFIAVGVGLLGSPFWSYLKARRTLYAVTDRRALIIENARTKKVRSYGPADIRAVERTERTDGSGDLSFGRLGGARTDPQARMETVMFVGIPDVGAVEPLLRRLSATRPLAD